MHTYAYIYSFQTSSDFPLSASSLEDSLRRLQEQLQHNLMQQTYLLNGSSNKVVENAPSTIELAVKSKALESNQQQLMLRIQWIQQQLAIAVNTFKLFSLKLFEVTKVYEMFYPIISFLSFFQHSSTFSGLDVAFLFESSRCRWTGCDCVCADLASFIKHAISEHSACDDRSVGQLRLQLQLVSQLESQLKKEQERLQVMTAHLTRSSVKVQLNCRTRTIQITLPGTN